MTATKSTSSLTRTLFTPISQDLVEVDRILEDALAGYSDGLSPLTDYLRLYRGKRLRPALLLLVAKACGEINSSHHTLAAAMEMIHTATLMHDDVLDDADTRRHVKTVNAGWGNQVAILLGDMLFSHAFAITATVDAKSCRLIGEATNRVCAGELKQVSNRGNLRLTESEYFDLIDGKTAALTECCGRLGAIYAGMNDEVIERMASYGRNLGIAFQIADDLLDVTGQDSIAGKTLGTDAKQQKLTLPLIHCLSKLPPADAADLKSRLAANQPSFEHVTAALNKTGSLAHARYRAEEFAKSAMAELDELSDSPAKHVLMGLPNWAILRDR